MIPLGISWEYGQSEAVRLSVRPMRARVGPAREGRRSSGLPQVQEPLLGRSSQGPEQSRTRGSANSKRRADHREVDSHERPSPKASVSRETLGYTIAEIGPQRTNPVHILELHCSLRSGCVRGATNRQPTLARPARRGQGGRRPFRSTRYSVAGRTRNTTETVFQASYNSGLDKSILIRSWPHRSKWPPRAASAGGGLNVQAGSFMGSGG